MFTGLSSDPDDETSAIQQLTALSSEIDPDLSDQPDFAGLRDYWASKRQGDALPRYAEIDPLDLKTHLGSLFVVEMLEDGSDFRYRLIGTDLTATHGKDYTKRTVTETFSGRHPDFGVSAIRAYKKCLREGKPLLARGQVVWANKDYLRFASLHLPCSSDGARADIIVGKLVFLRRTDDAVR